MFVFNEQDILIINFNITSSERVHWQALLCLIVIMWLSSGYIYFEVRVVLWEICILKLHIF